MVKIISDSTSDLSQDLLDRYNITLVPLIVRLGDQQYEDRVNITSEEIFRWSDSTKKAPTTACANVWTIQEVFQKYLETYDEIVAFSISGKMSATGSNMVEAAAELGASDRIHVVDSQSLSTGIGLLNGAGRQIRQGNCGACNLADSAGSRVLCRRYADVPAPRRALLRRGGADGQHAEAAPEDCRA